MRCTAFRTCGSVAAYRVESRSRTFNAVIALSGSLNESMASTNAFSSLPMFEVSISSTEAMAFWIAALVLAAPPRIRLNSSSPPRLVPVAESTASVCPVLTFVAEGQPCDAYLLDNMLAVALRNPALLRQLGTAPVRVRVQTATIGYPEERRQRYGLGDVFHGLAIFGCTRRWTSVSNTPNVAS
jgi:hypothetical protein